MLGAILTRKGPRNKVIPLKVRYATDTGSSLGTEIAGLSNLDTGCLLPAIIAVADSDVGGLYSHVVLRPYGC